MWFVSFFVFNIDKQESREGGKRVRMYIMFEEYITFMPTYFMIIPFDENKG